MTRLVRFSNNAVSRLAANITNASTTISLTPGDGAKFPVIGGTQFFMATLIKSTGETEIVKVTARATDTLTVVRAAEPVGATQVAYAFSAGDRIEQRLTAKALSDELDRLDSGANIGATNKTANYTVQAADVSTLIRVDTTAGAITITLPEIASLADDFDIMVAKVTDNANAVNIVRAGSTDLINGATSYPVNNQWQSAWLIADRSTNTWTAINSGAATSSIVVDTFTGDGTAGPYTLSGDPVSKANTAVYLSGVYQQKATYTLSGTSLTMGGNVPVGVTVEVVWSRPLSIGRTDAEMVGYDGGTVQDVLDAVTGPTGAAYVGFQPAGTGAVATTVQEKLREVVSVKDKGVGEVAFLSSISDIGAIETELLVNDNVTITSNLTVPKNVTLKIKRGSVITINAGVTLTVLGEISAGNYTIFAGSGIIDLNAGSAFFNLSWFDGQYLNDKWDFVSRGLVSLRPFTVFVPKPQLGMQGTVEISPNLVYWGIDGPLAFPDKSNGCTWISGPEARIIAVAPIDAMIEFSSDSKVEDVTFTKGIWLDGDSKAAHGMKFHGGSRVRSNGLVQISDCGIPLYFDNTGGSNDKINFISLYLARWSEAAIWVEGSGNAMVACYFHEIILEQPTVDLKNCIVVRGSTRGIRFGRIHYIHFADAKVSDNIVLVQSTSNGYSVSLKVDEIYTSSAANCLVKIENSGGTQRAVYTSIGKLGGQGTTIPASLNYDIYTKVGEYTGPGILYGANCQEPIPSTDIISRTYDFSVSGGSVGTYNLGGSLPKGSTVVRAWYRVLTGFSSGGSATLRLGITGSLAGIQSILPFNDAAWSVGLHDGIPSGTASTALPEVADSVTFPSFVVANAPITAGKVVVYMQIVK